MMSFRLLLTLSLILLTSLLRAAERLDERIDYVREIEGLYVAVTADALANDRDRLAEPLKQVMKRCRERGKAEQADYTLAETTYLLADELLGLVGQWRDLKDDLRRVSTEGGMLKTGDAARDRAAHEERIRQKTGNVKAQWERHAQQARAGQAGQRLAELKRLQAKLDQAIAAGELRVGRQEVVSAPPPLPRPPPVVEEPPPLPKPPPVVEEPPPTATVPNEPVQQGPDQKTPPALLPVVRETAVWLEAAQRRAGGQLATHLYAEQGNGQATLYVEMTAIFPQLKRDAQLQLAESIWQFWAMKCRQHGQVARDAQARLVLRDRDGKVLASSSPTDGSRLQLAR